MLATVAKVLEVAIPLLAKLLDKLPPEERCAACRALELELARRRVVARAEARFAARKASRR